METDILRRIIEAAATGIEVVAVLVIVLAVLIGTGRALLRQGGESFKTYKERLTKALLLSLEFLVAADIVRTVAIETTLTNVAILGLLVVVRTVLSWSLVVEMEGRWPWEIGEAGLAKESR